VAKPLAVAGVVVALLGASGAASGNGAFPDSFGILLPADPQQLILATNFGLVISEDGGKSWQWACEHDAGDGGFRYKWTAPGRLLSVAAAGLVLSDDLGCNWRAAAGFVGGARATDYFIDPTNARRVLAVAVSFTGEWRLFESDDGGASFPRTLLTTGADTALVGVETAFSDPRTIYVATQVRRMGDPARLQLMRSRDGGATWETLALPPALGTDRMGVITVDQRDPNRLLLRTPDGLTDRVLLSEDGGQSAKVVLEFAGTLTSYLQRADGTILLGGTDSVHGTLFQSKDGGRTFAAMANAPNFRGLGERAGRVYAVADDFLDRFALAVGDESLTRWEPIMKYADIGGIRRCGDLPVICRLVCQGMRYRIPLCVSELTPVDAAASDVGVDAPVTDAGVRPEPPSSQGCQCRTGASGGPSWLCAVLLMALLRRMTLPGRRRAGRSRLRVKDTW
jgi:photosystem II stability/assembly factor-like uncharacterized protein